MHFTFGLLLIFAFGVYSFVSQGQGPGTAIAVTHGHDHTRPVATADAVADFPVYRRQKYSIRGYRSDHYSVGVSLACCRCGFCLQPFRLSSPADAGFSARYDKVCHIPTFTNPVL